MKTILRFILRFGAAHKTIVVGTMITAAIPLLTALKDLDTAVLSDPRSWIVGVVVASLRQVGAYLLSKISLEA